MYRCRPRSSCRASRTRFLHRSPHDFEVSLPTHRSRSRSRSCSLFLGKKNPMANTKEAEESSPLLKVSDEAAPESMEKPSPAAAAPEPQEKAPPFVADEPPVWGGIGTVVGEPVGRAQWNSSLFACLGRNDEFCSSDLEVCMFQCPPDLALLTHP